MIPEDLFWFQMRRMASLRRVILLEISLLELRLLETRHVKKRFPEFTQELAAIETGLTALLEERYEKDLLYHLSILVRQRA